MEKIKVGIVGGTGYTAGELLRILIHHPEAEIVSVYSHSCAGMPVSSVHRDLFGECDLKFSADTGHPDVLFLCLGHGLSRDFLKEHSVSPDTKIVDLGNDFRLEPLYGDKEFVYGLSDAFREDIVRAQYVANPGCFATAIQNALCPLAQAGMLPEEVHITAITGATGAGKKLSEKCHFSYREGNMSIYKLFSHQHIPEIRRTLSRLSGKEAPQLNFVPVRGDFTRGIFASVYCRWLGGEIAPEDLFRSYYKDSPFTFVSPEAPSLKEVVNTNKSLLHVELHQGYVHVTSVLDNLVKGASGQAVENMNLMFGLPQDCGLRMKGSAF